MALTAVPDWLTAPHLPNLPPDILTLFDISPGSSAAKNPYHIPVLTLAQLRGREATHENLIEFMRFITFMTDPFRRLIEGKDPRALLLLAWWFWKLESAELWWLTSRAKVEGRAIRVWLQQWWGDVEGLLKVLAGDGDGREEGEVVVELRGLRGETWNGFWICHEGMGRVVRCSEG